MKTSKAGIDLIKRWEGVKLTAYKCPAGIWTIGYGHTSAAGSPKVVAGMTITTKEAEEILTRDLLKYETAVKNALTRAPNQNQFDAMVSLCYNIGPGAFKKSSVAKRFNEGNVAGAAEALRMWNKAGGKVLQGLVNRREDERKLFLKPVGTVAQPPKPVIVPPPTPVEVLEPLIDVEKAADKTIAGWLIGIIAFLIAAAAAWIVKGS
jgi:lysozyme